ncbi:MAG TPA: fructosamine kinase family protein [Balneolales bacterium]|nr:fructosamine kinase family protein [Balneolales bacterium]
MINDALREHIESSQGKRIQRTHPVSGGDINQASFVEMNDGTTCFLKYNAREGRDMFEKEVKGLQLLRDANAGFLIPDVLDYGFVEGPNVGYLLLEYITTGTPTDDFHKQFGRQLADLHSISNDHFGLDHNNYIGRLPQSNHFHADWVSFFIEERLEPQLKMAIDDGKLTLSVHNKFKSLYHKLDDLLPREPPALLHGDLWSGNYMCGSDQKTVLIDPAVYYGHREIELAFTQLFGSFNKYFYSTYKESYPLEPGFDERRDIYNLYPLLVHTNLFGGSYSFRVQTIISHYG